LKVDDFSKREEVKTSAFVRGNGVNRWRLSLGNNNRNDYICLTEEWILEELALYVFQDLNFREVSY